MTTSPIKSQALSIKKISSTLALFAILSSRAWTADQTSTLAYYANDMVSLKSAKCFHHSSPTTNPLEKALNETDAPTDTPCNGDVCFNPKNVSPEQSLRILYLWNVKGVNVFNGGYAHSRPFSISELDSIIQTISLLPQPLLQQVYGFSVVHMTTRKASIQVGMNQFQTFSPRAWTDEQNTIRLHERFDELSPSKKVSTLFHEIGHVVANSLKTSEPSPYSTLEKLVQLDTSRAWFSVAGWDDYQSISRPEIAASGYARGKYGSAGEDFAESFVRYRLGPQSFLHYLKNHAEKYYFFRDHVFEGIEYLSEQVCQEAERTTAESNR